MLSGIALTIFGVHYNGGPPHHRQRRRAARFVIRHFEGIRTQFETIFMLMGAILEQRGPNALAHDTAVIYQHARSILNQDSILDDLDDTTLRRNVEVILDQAVRAAMDFPDKEIKDAWSLPLDPGTVETFRSLRGPIETEVIANINEVLDQLRQRDVSYFFWILRRFRQ